MYYEDTDEKPLYFPHIGDTIYRHCEIKPYETSSSQRETFLNAHIYSFLNYFYQAIANGTILYPELSYYVADGINNNMVIED